MASTIIIRGFIRLRSLPPNIAPNCIILAITPIAPAIVAAIVPVAGALVLWLVIASPMALWLAALGPLVAVASIEQAIAQAQSADKLCVIGGGQVYAQVLARADALHLTWVDTVVEHADAFFPAFDPKDWGVSARQPHPADARHGVAFEFIDYSRKG